MGGSFISIWNFKMIELLALDRIIISIIIIIIAASLKVLLEVTCWINAERTLVLCECKPCVIYWADESVVGHSMHQESEVSLAHSCHLPSAVPTATFFTASCWWPQYCLHTTLYRSWISLRKLRVSGRLNSILLTFGNVPKEEFFWKPDRVHFCWNWKFPPCAVFCAVVLFLEEPSSEILARGKCSSAHS